MRCRSSKEAIGIGSKRPDIFQRELAGEVISLSDPEHPKIAALITEAQRLIAEMNTGYRDPAEVRALFAA